MKCYECAKGIMKIKQVDYKLHGISLGRFPAEVCPKCGEKFFSSETSKKIELAAKKKKVWGLCMRTTVGKSGNALDVRIAQPLAKFVGMTKGDQVMIHPEGKNKLTIELM